MQKIDSDEESSSEDEESSSEGEETSSEEQDGNDESTDEEEGEETTIESEETMDESDFITDESEDDANEKENSKQVDGAEDLEIKKTYFDGEKKSFDAKETNNRTQEQKVRPPSPKSYAGLTNSIESGRVVDFSRSEEKDVEGTQSNQSSAPLRETKGAQILISRFSSWRKKANEAVTQNVVALSESQQFKEFKTIASAAISKKTQAKSKKEENNSIASKIKKENENASNVLNGKQKSDMTREEEENNNSEEPPIQLSPIVLKNHSIMDNEGDSTEDDSKSDDSTNSQGYDFQSTEHTGHKVSRDEANFRAVDASLYMRTAASVMVDSVATSFRGRYGEGVDGELEQKKEPSRKSQTAKILSSRAAAHMQSMLNTLDESHEYVMLLGNGMLGVNLRQTYLKNHGVYVDYLVEGGAAYNSRVIFPGDIIQKVGAVDVRKGTIFNVPQTIADARRPTVLVFSTGQKVVDSKVNYIDLTIALMHQLHEKYIPEISDNDFNPSGISQGNKETEINLGNAGTKHYELEVHPLDAINPVNIPPPPADTIESVKLFLAKRGTGMFTLQEMTSLAMNTGMDSFRIAIRNAFVTCALDGRKLPFLSRHLTTCKPDAISHKGFVGKSENERTTASIELMLFLELTSFVELYGTVPKSRRCSIAKRIAFKFFLKSKIGERTENPMFDFSQLCTKLELEKLQEQFERQNREGKPVERSIFLKYQDAVVKRLCEAPFISFLLSDECARMRGYLRNTSLYWTVSPEDFFHYSVDVKHKNHHAKNHLLYNIVFLLCQRERDICGENHDIVGDQTNRVLGAAGGLCCAIFIRKHLLQCMEKVKLQFDEDITKFSSLSDKEVFKNLIEVVEQAWNIYFSPEGGALEWTSTSNETYLDLSTVRKELLTASSEKTEQNIVDLLSSSKMQQALKNLSDNLLYDYAVDGYTKFRESPFHEWMCSEINRSSNDVYDIENRIPKLLGGCISRFLRMVELPKGLSSHKPSRDKSETSKNSSQNDHAKLETDYPSAHHAIIFGTDDGSEMVDQTSNPVLSQFDLRRYVRQEVFLENSMCTKPVNLCPVHSTIENYAVVPPRRQSPFSQLIDNFHLSAEGWEISLIDFMIPGATGECATYGVSLVFQQNEESFMRMMEESHSGSNLIQLQYTESENNFAESRERFTSPFSISPSKLRAEDAGSMSRVLEVAIETPSFNRRLAGKSWMERIKQQRKSLPTGTPIAIGIVLISSQNVIYSMRDALSQFLRDISRETNHAETSGKIICNPLIELLGNFSYCDVEAESLRFILQPYLQYGIFPWIEQPLIESQATQFEKESGQRLVESLPLIPLCLLFVTTLLEQKVVFSSSRRSLLLSATMAITKLLEPLKWEHLLVPMAPSSLAEDLLEYPAPFIIGLASEDENNLELLNSLPDDVSLVDLDVGRVILAPNLNFNDDISGRYTENGESLVSALRSQMLYLAQALGLAFGARLQSNVWNVDSDFSRNSFDVSLKESISFETLKILCFSFLSELMDGSASCSYWIEECSGKTEEGLNPTILFDEDRFFRIKSLRALGKYSSLFKKDKKIGEFALNLEDFDIVMKCFLRCQNVSTFISSRRKRSLAFS